MYRLLSSFLFITTLYADPITITDLTIRDIRFPTSEEMDGSDAMHADPDYSAVYVTVHTNEPGLSGNGLTFTLGRGNEVCAIAVKALEKKVIGKTLEEITSDFAGGFARVP